MSRTLCQTCLKPVAACICSFFCSIENDINVVLLQHPNEVGKMKGSAPLLQHSLKHCITVVDENFTENPLLNELLNDKNQQIFLLYPSEQAQVITDIAPSLLLTKDSTAGSITLLIIDATWKKAYRMYMLSENLHSLVHLVLPENMLSHYLIRKTQKKNALSTLEACAYALATLEAKPTKYDELVNKFIAFNQFQLSFRSK